MPPVRQWQQIGWRPYAAAAAVAAATLWLAAPAGSQRYMPTGDPEHPRLKFADSLVSLNDRCIVRQVKLNPKVRPVYVSRHPVGFC